MQLRYNYRLYPNMGQRAALAQAFGCARVVFNDGLRARQEAFAAGRPFLTDKELSARLTAAKATPERAWLGEVSAVVLQQALADLNAADRIFFASAAGQRKGPKVGPPRFRSRKDRRQAIRFTANARFKVLPGGKLRLPKIGDVTVRWSRELPSAPSSVTDGHKPLHVRQWACASCGTVHDRDLNAARNVLALGRRERIDACGDGIRPLLAVAAVSEPGTHRGAA
jgi:putative transposase